MAAGKLPPRQKMIGLMYLVLLALLAMNVSKSILESFVIINHGIENTAGSFEKSNEIMYSKLSRAAGENPAFGKYNKKALKIKKEAQELYDHINLIKSKMYQVIDQLTPDVADTISLSEIKAKDNYDEPSRLMGIASPEAPGSAKDCEECSSTLLKEKINSFHELLLTTFDDKNIQDALKEKLTYLETPEMHNHDGAKDPWEVGMFYHNPLAAIITTLSKIQSDVRTAEAEVVGKLYENIGGDVVSFNTVVGMAVMPKAYILEGDSFSANIFTAAYDDASNPEIYITTAEYDTIEANKVNTSGKLDIKKIMKGTEGKAWGEGDWYKMSDDQVANGKGNLKIKTGVGVHDWGGIIVLKTKKGPKVYTFESSFEVGKPSTTIAATAMNVFYAGIDNPISVSAPMPNFKVSGGGIRAGKGQGQYVIKPKKSGEITINVTGITDGGKTVQLGKQKFRVKRIPTPVAYIGGKTGTVKLTKSKFGNGVINAKMEGFVFDLRVKVKSFTLGTTVSGDYKSVKVTGNRMNARCKSLIKKASRGQRFYLENMQVKMPDGRTVKLGNVTVKIG